METRAPRLRPRVLLALDCDGTLLDSYGKVRPLVRQAVRAAGEAGAIVTLATGRRLAAVRSIAEQTGICAPLVLIDGAVVQDPVSLALLYQDPLPPRLLAALVDLTLANHAHPVIYQATADGLGEIAHALYTADTDPLMVPYLQKRENVQLSDRTYLCTVPSAVLFTAIGHQIPIFHLFSEVCKRARDLGCTPQLRLPPASVRHPYFALGTRNQGCSKSRALSALASHMGLTLSECIVVGDGDNDLDLLRDVHAAGGVSIAMGHAPTHVRATARYVVRSNDEDGVVQAIEHHVLPLLK